jgi:hypothetical protein
LGVFVDENLAVEYPDRLVVEDALIDLEGVTIRLGVVDPRVVVVDLLVDAKISAV